MKRVSLLFLALNLLVVGSGKLSAQSGVAGVEYFQPGYAYRHMLNPAFVPQWGYVGIPVLGLLNMDVRSNLGLADFLYPLENGKLGTFMHPEVSSEEFLSNIKKRNKIGIGLNTNILSAGWFWGKAFWNVHVGLKSNLQLGIPYEFFDFVKNEMDANPTRYTISDLEASLRAYVEVGIGYSRVLNDEFSVGGKFKFLIGIAEAELRVNSMDIALSDEAWRINTNADFRVFGRILESEMPDGSTFPTLAFGAIAPAGYGAAIDLGGEYRPSFLPGLRFSLALTDLGFLSYKPQDIAQYTAKGEVLFEGFGNVGPDMDVEQEVDGLVSDLESMATFEEVPVDENLSRMINPTLNIGAEYGFWGNRFSVGLLNTTTFYHAYAQSDLSVIANIHPVRWFSVSLAYSFMGGGNGFGWALNITPSHGINLFLASNYTPLQVNPQFIPLKRANANIQLGLTIPLGRNRAYTQDKEPHDVNVFPYGFEDPENHPNKVMMRKMQKK